MSICGNMVGGAAPIKTLIIEDENGTEFVGTVVGEEVVLTANAKTDIREGVVAATEEGVVTGSAVIPNYETTSGQKAIMAGCDFTLKLSTHDVYDYTELQCIICPFNTSVNDSVAAEQVVIGDNVYNVNSTSVAATLTKNTDNKSIVFNITNNSDIMYIIRYFTYKELY